MERDTRMTFLFIHGAGSDGSAFDRQIGAFPDSRAITLPGRDGVPGAPETIAAFADAVECELSRFAGNGAIVCGSSMGGAIALEVALRSHAPLAGVVTIGSGSRLRVAAALFESLERNFENGSRELAKLLFADPKPALVEPCVAVMRRVGKAQTVRDFRACDAYDATERLAGLTVPLLAIAGSADVLTPPKYAHFLADRVPDGEARILDGAGHLAMIERPDETNAALRAFADRLAHR